MIAGEDSLQALVLGLGYITRTLKSRAAEAGGTVVWLDERERPVFASTWQIEWYERIISDLFDGVRAAMRLLDDDPTGSPAAALETLRRTLVATKFEPPPKKQDGANEAG